MSQPQVPGGPSPGSNISLFVYVNGENRPALTGRIPRVRIREYALGPYITSGCDSSATSFSAGTMLAVTSVPISTHHDGREVGMRQKRVVFYQSGFFTGK